MADNVQMNVEPGIGSLLSGILHDIQVLFKQQMALFKHEVRSDMRRTIEATVYLIAGALVAFVGAFVLCLMLVYLLKWLVPEMELWVCYGIVGLVVTGGGAALLLWGRQKFRSFNPLPDESMAALKENLEWTTKPR